MRITLVQNPLAESGIPEIDESNRGRWQHNLDVISKAIRSHKHDVTTHISGPGLETSIRESPPDLVFLQSFRIDPGGTIFSAMALFESMDIPFTGSPTSAFQLARDKYRAKTVFREQELPTPHFNLIPVNTVEFKKPADLHYPLFIKPIHAGASQGIHPDNPVSTDADFTRVAHETIAEVGQPLLVEEFVQGREFTVGILGNHPPVVLPIREFLDLTLDDFGPKFRSFSGKADKVHKERTICPAALSDDERVRIADLAVRAFQALGCADYGRVDFRLDEEGNPLILEINVHPSLLPDSSFPKMAAVYGMEYSETIGTILGEAASRIQ